MNLHLAKFQKKNLSQPSALLGAQKIKKTEKDLLWYHMKGQPVHTVSVPLVVENKIWNDLPFRVLCWSADWDDQWCLNLHLRQSPWGQRRALVSRAAEQSKAPWRHLHQQTRGRRRLVDDHEHPEAHVLTQVLQMLLDGQVWKILEGRVAPDSSQIRSTEQKQFTDVHLVFVVCFNLFALVLIPKP